MMNFKLAQMDKQMLKIKPHYVVGKFYSYMYVIGIGNINSGNYGIYYKLCFSFIEIAAAILICYFYTAVKL